MSDHSFSAASYALVRLVDLTRPPDAAPGHTQDGKTITRVDIDAKTNVVVIGGKSH